MTTRVAHFMIGSRRSSVLFLAPDCLVEDMTVVNEIRDASRRDGEEARCLFILLRTFRSRTTCKNLSTSLVIHGPIVSRIVSLFAKD